MLLIKGECKLAQAPSLNQRVYKIIPFRVKLYSKRNYSTRRKSQKKVKITLKEQVLDTKNLKDEDEGIYPQNSLNHHFNKNYPVIVKGEGIHLTAEDGREIFDASSGAAVASIGYGNQKVIEAMHNKNISGTHYLASSF